MSSVLARPGTPMISELPPTNNVCSTSSMTSCWPMMRLCSSARIALRPLFILSARAMSSGEFRSRVSATLLLLGWLYLLLGLELPDGARLQRQVGEQLFELGVVLVGRHAVLAQPQ